MAAARFSPIYHPKSTWLNSKEHYPLWREAEKLGVCFNYYIAPHQMPMLEDMAGGFPGVNIVVDHAGKPDLKLQDPWPEFKKMFRLKKFPQVWISNSEPYEMSAEEAPQDVSSFRSITPPSLRLSFGPTDGTWIAQGPGPTTNGQVQNLFPNNEIAGAIHAVPAHPMEKIRRGYR